MSPPSTALKRDLLAELERLGPAEQRRVVEFAHSLAMATSKGTPGRKLLAFAGVLDEESGREVEEAIREGCEGIDPDAW